jgi:hypothetical protein
MCQFYWRHCSVLSLSALTAEAGSQHSAGSAEFTGARLRLSGTVGFGYSLLLNYSFSGANADARNNDTIIPSTYYLNLRSGANLGAWRLRNYSTWNRDSKGNENWDSINTYLQRDIQALRSQLTLGSNSPAEFFDLYRFVVFNWRPMTTCYGQHERLFAGGKGNRAK